ncbi:hypothetical protein B14911_26080 [Bacillus sp. NRRL B-14911]|nr:hypothetical protein B14911_26080 [Bacillus sp. NRRL B-14911]
MITVWASVIWDIDFLPAILSSRVPANTINIDFHIQFKSIYITLQKNLLT